jgi:hypothetical protein
VIEERKWCVVRALDPGPVVEELAETNGEDKVPEEGMIETGEKERARVLIGEREQESPDNAKGDRQPIAENDVYKTEGEGTGKEQEPAGPEQGLVPVEKEGPIKQLLGINGEKRVEEHHQGPESRSALHKGKQQFWSEEAHREPKERKKHRIAQQDDSQLLAKAVEGKETAGIIRRVVPEDEENRECSEKQIGNRKVGKDATEDEQGNADKEEGKLQRE